MTNRSFLGRFWDWVSGQTFSIGDRIVYRYNTTKRGTVVDVTRRLGEYTYWYQPDNSDDLFTVGFDSHWILEKQLVDKTKHSI